MMPTSEDRKRLSQLPMSAFGLADGLGRYSLQGRGRRFEPVNAHGNRLHYWGFRACGCAVAHLGPRLVCASGASARIVSCFDLPRSPPRKGRGFEPVNALRRKPWYASASFGFPYSDDKALDAHRTRFTCRASPRPRRPHLVIG